MKRVATSLSLLIAAAGGAASPQAAARRVWAWADGDPAAVAQWRNASWAGVFDGVQASCGMSFVARSSDEVELQVNDTVFDSCRPLLAAVRETGGVFQVWTNGIPPECLTSPAAAASAAASAARVAQAYQIDGISLDDESDCAPRSTLANFTRWVAVVDGISAALRAAGGRSLSAAVQAMFGILDVPYAPLCQPPEDAQCSQACHLAPWAYAPDPRVTSLMQGAEVTWLEMDTYYFTTARFLNALQYYVAAVPGAKLSVALENRADLSPDDLAARFHAVDHCGADVATLNVFMLPAFDSLLPWLHKFKSRCASCPNGGALSCYEPTVTC